MKLHCLGTAGYHPNEKRQTSCYYVPEANLLLDAGTGLFRISDRLAGSELNLFLSHAHLDHVIGITFFLEIMALTKLKKIRLFGEEEKLSTIRNHLFAPLLFPVLPDIEWHSLEVRENPFQLESGWVTWFPLDHPGGSVGYRFDFPNHSFAYVTDTFSTSDAAYWQILKGVDLLLHECNFRDDQADFAKETGHSHPQVVLQSARTAGVKHLVLTHFDPVQSEQLSAQLKVKFATEMGLRVSCADDGAVFPIG